MPHWLISPLPVQPSIGTHSHKYPGALHQQSEAALQLEPPLNTDLSAIDTAVGETFAAATDERLLNANVMAEDIIAIGSHGQTIRHEPQAPEPYSLQTGNPDIIASHTGVDVIADFRRADIEAGGQGAPLVPAFHQAVFASDSEDRVILNTGGIAN